MKRTLLRTLSSMAMLCCLSLTATAAIPGEPVSVANVSANATDTGMRMVFSWNTRSQVSFTPEVRGQQVLLHFDSPVSLCWGKSLSRLQPYLQEVQTTDSGKTVTLSLSSPAQARRFFLYSRDGVDFTKNGVELSHPKHSVQTAAAPDSDASATKSTAPKATMAQLVKKAEKKPALQAKVKQAPLVTADEETASEATSAAPITAAIHPEAEAALKRELAAENPLPKPLAIKTPPTEQSRTEAETLAQLQPAAGSNEVIAQEATTPIVASEKATPALLPARTQDQKLADDKALAEKALADEQAHILAQLQPAAGSNEENATATQASLPDENPPSATPALPQNQAPAPAAATVKTEAERPAEAVSGTPAPATPVAPATVQALKATEPAKAAEVAKQAQVLEVISLPFLSGDEFALFSKGKTLWIVAPAATNLSEEALKNDNKDFQHSVQKITSAEGNALLVTFDAEPHVLLDKKADGKVVLSLTKEAAPPAHIVHPQLEKQDNKNSLMIEANKPGKIITLTDPESGQELHIVPFAAFGEGIGKARQLVEFALLPTAQGMVVQKYSDAITLRLNKETIEISTPAGITVSKEIEQQLAEAKTNAQQAEIPPVFFPYGAWKLDDEKKFVSTQLKLIRATLSQNIEEASMARLKLLQLFLAEGLFAEANGMANDILRGSYKFFVEHKVAALRGAANFFRDRYVEAEEDFQAPELAGLPETAMWQSLIAQAQSKDKAAFSFNQNYEPVLRYYPPSFIQKIAIMAADKDINRKEYESATAIFTTLQKENLDEPVKKYIDFMRGKILSETGNEEEAAKIWERQASDVLDRMFRARAEFSLVNMYLREDKIPVEDATQRLEKLRIVWRGDGLELNVLTLLGNLYSEQKDYTRALRAWRDIVMYYPTAREAIPTAQKMGGAFVRLYNKNAADEMPPLAALSLFYEFRDLVPTGADGDQMIRNLSERLVKIDLLDRASQLLNHQVRNRLQGAERSRVGVRLAEIYLMNRQPKQALETLKTTGYGELPPDTQLARIRLTAQALAQQGQLTKAIDVLSSDTSPDGNLLRLSVYWTNWDWPNVVSMAEEILSNRNDPSAALTVAESEVLLKLATAYVYEHDSGQIQYLRDYFTPLLNGNPNRESFLFITSESGNLDYGNLSNLDDDIRTVKTFIDKSRTNAPTRKSKGSPMALNEGPVKAVN